MKNDSRTREQQNIDLLNILNPEIPSLIRQYEFGNKNIRRDMILHELSDIHVVRGINSYFVYENADLLRQNFYTATLLLKESHIKGFNKDHGGAINNIYPFVFALLSDNSDCIKWIASEKIMLSDDPRSFNFQLHMIQLLLSNNFELLAEKISIFAKNASKKNDVNYIEGFDFFSLLIKREKEALEKFIYTEARRKIDSVLLRRFISPFATVLVKLCWMNGVEVNLNHSLIPMELMPVTPLRKYEIDYDFLHYDYVEPKLKMIDIFKKFFS